MGETTIDYRAECSSNLWRGAYWEESLERTANVLLGGSARATGVPMRRVRYFANGNLDSTNAGAGSGANSAGHSPSNSPGSGSPGSDPNSPQGASGVKKQPTLPIVRWQTAQFMHPQQMSLAYEFLVTLCDTNIANRYMAEAVLRRLRLRCSAPSGSGASSTSTAAGAGPFLPSALGSKNTVSKEHKGRTNQRAAQAAQLRSELENDSGSLDAADMGNLSALGASTLTAWAVGNCSGGDGGAGGAGTIGSGTPGLGLVPCEMLGVIRALQLNADTAQVAAAQEQSDRLENDNSDDAGAGCLDSSSAVRVSKQTNLTQLERPCVQPPLHCTAGGAAERSTAVTLAPTNGARSKCNLLLPGGVGGAANTSRQACIAQRHVKIALIFV